MDGVEGYYVARCGLPNRHPIYTVPKDKLSNFLEQIKRRSKLIPAPNHYKTYLSWETKNGQFHKNSKRLTFTDDCAKHSKQVPAPNLYKPEVKERVVLGKAE